ncbi:MAG: hypothetical protein QNI95_02540 [Desulfobacterales bacterium]|nr:hypothetical protein [Desulfobacterales bacterium]
MTLKATSTSEIITKAESYDGIRAGIVRLNDVLSSPSYQTPQRPRTETQMDDAQVASWPQEAQTVLLLGLRHSDDNPRLDYWESGDTWGNRRLREISENLKQWLREKYDLAAHPLPYHLEKGGLFLKDAAVLSGIGIIGRSNLLIHPEWGPRIRLRSILLEGKWQLSEVLENFKPCETCKVYCQKACPVKAFPKGKFSRPICLKQMNADVANKVPEGEMGDDGQRNLVIKYCRACEFACPVGA